MFYNADKTIFQKEVKKKDSINNRLTSSNR